MADQRITDPERIRGLAHPLRMELLSYLQDVDEATASECAQHLGESVASCSFHLRMLAKYGYIERGVQRGREKPWRPTSPGWEMRPEHGDEYSALPAVTELASLNVAREGDRVHRYLAQASREPEEWLHATTVATASFWATAEEMTELSEQVQQLTQRFAGRDKDPSLRPVGARRGRLFAAVNPDPIEASDEAQTNDEDQTSDAAEVSESQEQTND